MTYPIIPPKYGSYDYLMAEVGAVLGHGRNVGTWSKEQQGVANAVVQRGVREFYAPAPLPGKEQAHEWSFLRPIRQLTLESGTYKYDLPKDFAMLEGPLTFEPDQSTLYQPIRIVAEYEIRKRQQDTTTSGRPTIAALVAQPDGEGYQLWFWTTPDDSYTLEYVCQINPLDLSDENQMPYGGTVHYQTILEACLWKAEEEKQVAEGLHARAYEKRLAASISHDQRLMCPRSVGKNSARGSYRYDRRQLDMDVVTYDGSEWD